MANDLISQVRGLDFKERQQRLSALTTDFAALVSKHGLMAEDCQRVCEDQVVIGPDGQPRHELVCRMICT